MHNIYDVHKGLAEPCHIAETVSPFCVNERKSKAHSDRFHTASYSAAAEVRTVVPENAVKNLNMQKNNSNMSNL